MNNSALFPSGDWYGYYTYDWQDERYPMEMNIQFHSDHMLSASGGDPVGEFTCYGFYNESQLSCSWEKQYRGAHDVTYYGKRISRGMIVGSWSLLPQSGTFVIWPFNISEASLRKRDPEKPSDRF